MRKIISILLAAVLGVSIMSGCSGGGEQNESNNNVSADKVSVGVSIYDFADEFSIRLRDTSEEYADIIKCNCDISDGGGEQSTQNSNISAHIRSGVNALCVEVVERYSGVTVADEARAAGIPLVFLNRKPVEDAMALYDRTYYVGVNDDEVGSLLGELMAESWVAKRDAIDKNGDGVLQCAVFTCGSDTPEMKSRIDAAMKSLQVYGVPTQKVKEDSSASTKDEAREQLETWYSEGDPGIEAVISSKDEVALGAIEALAAKGYFFGEKYMPVVSAGGIPAALQAIASGTLYGTVSLNAEEQTKTAIHLAVEAVNGSLGEYVNGYDIVERYVWIPCEKVDSTNYMDML